MSLVASFCKGVNKHRFGKRFYAMPMVQKKNVRRSGGPIQWLPLRKPAMHHSTPGTTDRKASSILPNPPDATRPNCPTTSAETANHRAHDKWPVGHSDKKTSTQLCPAAPADPPASTNSRALRAHDCRDRRGALQPTRSGQASPSPANKTQSVARPLRPPRSTHARQPSADTRDVRH